MADQALTYYTKAATFMRENLEQAVERVYHKSYHQGKKDLRGLIEEENEERAAIGQISSWR